MSVLSVERSWLPQSPRGMGLGALLALLAHAALIAALAMGLNWRNRSETVVMTAELWAAMPQLAAPAPAPAPVPAAAPLPQPQPAKAEPPPAALAAPPDAARADAQIAIEKAERARKAEAQAQRAAAERSRLEAERLKLLKAREDKARDDKARADKAREDRRQQELAEQAEAKAADARIAKQREDNLKRMLGQAGTTGTAANAGTTGSAAQDAAPSAAYAGRIKARIKPNIVLTTEVSGNPVTEVEVKCAPDGQIIGRRIVKGSGNAAWDDTVLRAIDRTDGLPRDVDGRIPATMILVFPRRE